MPGAVRAGPRSVRRGGSTLCSVRRHVGGGRWGLGWESYDVWLLSGISIVYGVAFDGAGCTVTSRARVCPQPAEYDGGQGRKAIQQATPSPQYSCAHPPLLSHVTKHTQKRGREVVRALALSLHSRLVPPRQANETARSTHKPAKSQEKYSPTTHYGPGTQRAFSPTQKTTLFPSLSLTSLLPSHPIDKRRLTHRQNGMLSITCTRRDCASRTRSERLWLFVFWSWRSCEVVVFGDGVGADFSGSGGLTRWGIGQHSQDEEHLLQGQGVPQAHRPQGHPVQGWQGTLTPMMDSFARDANYVARPPCSRTYLPSRHRAPHDARATGHEPQSADFAHRTAARLRREPQLTAPTARVSAVMTASRAVMVVRPSPSSTRRRRPRRRLCSGWSA